MKPKGGRGHTAPYATVMVRTPVPLKDQVKELIERYRESISAGGDPLNPPRLLEAIADAKPVDKFDKPVDKLNELDQELESLDQQLESNPHEWASKAHEEYVITIQAKKIQFLEAKVRLLKLELAYNKPVNEFNKPVDNLSPLNLTQLMQRLGQNSRGYAQRIRLEPAKFSQWSRSHDPQGIGWLFDKDSKLYNPVL